MITEGRLASSPKATEPIIAALAGGRVGNPAACGGGESGTGPQRPPGPRESRRLRRGSSRARQALKKLSGAPRAGMDLSHRATPETSPAITLALDVTRALRRVGRVEFRGLTARHAGDLALLPQVRLDNRLEPRSASARRRTAPLDRQTAMCYKRI